MRTIILCFILLSFSLPGLAQPVTHPAAKSASDDPQQLLEKVQQHFYANSGSTAIHNVTADFYQKATIASLNRTQTGRGTMAMKFEPQRIRKDGKDGTEIQTLFHWDYQVPNQQQVICDGKTLWVYLPDNNQVMVSAVNDKSYYSEDPLLFLRNLGQLSNYFAATWATPQRNASNDYLLQLTPLKASVYIKTLTLAIPVAVVTGSTEAIFPLRRASVLDPTGNTTKIEFRNVKVNQDLALQKFQFAVPDGVDVVRPSDLSLDFK